MPIGIMEPELIEIEQPLPGFNRFIGSWIRNGRSGVPTVLVDPGPAGSVRRLTAALDRRGIDRIDYVLITHIHIDHAGGLGDILDRYPMAMAVCHEKAVPYLVDPAGLWQGSVSVLGDIAGMYGRPAPVSPARLLGHLSTTLAGLDVLETPGHAAHHLSFSFEGSLFAGEAGGNYIALPDGGYLRPATPPRFFMAPYLESVDRLLTLENQPVYYGHFGRAADSRKMLRRFREQLLRWEDIIGREAGRGGDHLISRSMEALLGQDPELGLFAALDPAVQERERFFITNSIKGILGYLKNRPPG